MAFHFRNTRPSAGWLFTRDFRTAGGASLEERSLGAPKAGMGPEHLVKLVQYLVRKEDLPAYRPIRARFIGDCRPASMLLIAAALPKPGFLIEIEAVAAVPA